MTPSQAITERGFSQGQANGHDGSESDTSPLPISCLDASGKPTRVSAEERMRRNRAAIESLKALEEIGDEEDHRETMDLLRHVLGEERTISNRKLF